MQQREHEQALAEDLTDRLDDGAVVITHYPGGITLDTETGEIEGTGAGMYRVMAVVNEGPDAGQAYTLRHSIRDEWIAEADAFRRLQQAQAEGRTETYRVEYYD